MPLQAKDRYHTSRQSVARQFLRQAASLRNGQYAHNPTDSHPPRASAQYSTVQLPPHEGTMIQLIVHIHIQSLVFAFQDGRLVEVIAY